MKARPISVGRLAYCFAMEGMTHDRPRYQSRFMHERLEGFIRGAASKSRPRIQPLSRASPERNQIGRNLEMSTLRLPAVPMDGGLSRYFHGIGGELVRLGWSGNRQLQRAV